LIVLLIPLIVGLILLVIGKFAKNKNKQTTSYQILKEWVFCVLLIFQFQLTISFGIDSLFNPNIIGKIIGAVLLVGLIAMLVLFFKRPLNFGEFKSFFVQ
jgi:hypothetical protein